MNATLRLMRAFYEQYGYTPYHMSRFENYELYADKKDFLLSDRVVTFSDTDGTLRALRPDVTLSIVKSAELKPGEKKKLYYQENVYRPSGDSGRVREIMQCGLECLGDLTGEDLSEVLELAALSLRAVSEDNMLCFSHLGIVDCLFQKLDANEWQQTEILKLLSSRNLHQMAELFDANAWNPALLRDIGRLLEIDCGLEDLPKQLSEFPWIKGCFLEELSGLKDRCTVHFDFSIIDNTHYYNGLVFQGFVPGVSEKLLSGGQYDRLMARMHRKGRAIGFAVYFNLLKQSDREDEMLVIYDDDTDPKLFQERVFTLHAGGKTVKVAKCRDITDLRGGTLNA